MLKIALTGGIGCGKTTAANYFALLGVPIINTDIIARQLLSKNSNAWHTLGKKFGEEIYTQNRKINRPLLRQKVFDDPALRRWLEELLHPLVYKELLEQLNKLARETHYVLIEAPLLFETHLQAFRDLMDKVIVVNCHPKSQINHLKNRNPDLTTEQISAILDAQLTSQQRCAKADFILNNFSSLADLHNQILIVHNQLMLYTQS